MNSPLIHKSIFCVALLALILSACLPTQAAAPASPTSEPSLPQPTSISIQPSPTPTDTLSVRSGQRLPTSTAKVSGDLGAKIDQYIRRNYPLFSGSVLVAHKGEILLSGGYQYSNWELETPNTASTKFRLASLTKPFTALAIMMLQEQGKLTIEDPICNYIADCPKAWKPITIRHLLTHTSGLTDYSIAPDAKLEARQSHSCQELIASFRDQPLNFPPGARFEYSNSGYVLLGTIIETVSRLPYRLFMQVRIFEPLGMKDSGYDCNTCILKERASGYTITGRTLQNASYIDNSNLFSTAGLYSTVEDLHRWTQALYQGQLVSPASLQQVFYPQVSAPEVGENYGYGWAVSELQGRNKVWHVGFIPGFRNYLAYFPKEDVDIIVLCNLDTSKVIEMAQGIEAIVFQGLDGRIDTKAQGDSQASP